MPLTAGTVLLCRQRGFCQRRKDVPRTEAEEPLLQGVRLGNAAVLSQHPLIISSWRAAGSEEHKRHGDSVAASQVLTALTDLKHRRHIAPTNHFVCQDPGSFLLAPPICSRSTSPAKIHQVTNFTVLTPQLLFCTFHDHQLLSSSPVTLSKRMFDL